MSDGTYELVFRGEILEGFDREHVKREFGRIFRLTAERLDEIFAHPHVVLRRDLSAEQATRYQDALSSLGLKILMRANTAHAADASGGTGEVAGTAEDAGQARTVPFEFSGRGGEFFRIWIVNVFLTILTLGIYSAWAKVRTQRYFYGNTRLDGVSFDYLANPLAILKGRLIAFGLFAAYTLSDLVSPLLSLGLMLVFLLFLPWIVVRALAFRARNSAWRNVRFDFTGSAWEAAKAFVLWPLLGAFSFGLLMPFALQRQAAFMVGNSRYGTEAFAFDAGVNAFYRIFFVALGIGVGGFLVAGIVAAVVPVLAPLLAVAVYLVLFIWFNVVRVNLVYGATAIADHRFEADYAFGSYAMLMLGNMLGLLLTFGLFYPWARVRTARYAAEHVRVHASGDLGAFSADQQRSVSAVGQEIGDIFDVDLGL
ncbi:MAG: YjgN family protein [Thiohalomonadaceae bacterium]